MLDDADKEAPERDPLNADDVYANYLRTRAMLGVTPTPRERAIELIREWAATFERGGKPLH